MPKTRGITPKQAKFVRGIVEGKTQTQAYIDAYDTKGHIPTVEAEASKTIRKPQVKEALLEAMTRKGISADSIAQTIQDGLQATKIVTSPTEPDREVADHPTRHKFLETTLKVVGVTTDKESGSINNFGNMIVTKADKYAD